MSKETCVRQSERTAARVINGKAVVVVIDSQELHTLNAVGTRVWELATPASVDSIARTIASEFDVTWEVARADVERFVGELLERGMLEEVQRR
ncbi:MAG: PqqD family protein [Sandaracinaceae bacterium]